jgi:hypothetical protein
MLLFSDEIKRSMCGEEAMGKRRDIDKWSPLHSASPRGGEALKSEGEEEGEI